SIPFPTRRSSDLVHSITCIVLCVSSLNRNFLNIILAVECICFHIDQPVVFKRQCTLGCRSQTKYYQRHIEPVRKLERTGESPEIVSNQIPAGNHLYHCRYRNDQADDEDENGDAADPFTRRREF